MKRTETELLLILNDADSSDLWYPDKAAPIQIFGRREDQVLETIDKIKISVAPLKLTRETSDQLQAGTLISSARVLDIDSIADESNASVKTMWLNMKARERAKVLDVLFSKFGKLVTIVIHDEYCAAVVYKNIKEILLHDSYQVIDYFAIKDLEYSGVGDFKLDPNLTWFDKFFSEEFGSYHERKI